MSELESEFDRLWQRIEAGVRFEISRYAQPHWGLETDDLMQEVRLKLWQVLAGEATTGEKKAPRAASYYLTVVQRAAIDVIRAQTAAKHGFGDPEAADWQPGHSSGHQASPEAAARNDEKARQLEASLSALPADRQRAVRLHLLGFNHEAIALQTGWTPARARNLLYRGIADLKSRMVGKMADR